MDLRLRLQHIAATHTGNTTLAIRFGPGQVFRQTCRFTHDGERWASQRGCRQTKAMGSLTSRWCSDRPNRGPTGAGITMLRPTQVLYGQLLDYLILGIEPAMADSAPPNLDVAEPRT